MRFAYVWLASLAAASTVPLFTKSTHAIPTLHKSFESLEPFLADIATGSSQSVAPDIPSSTLLVTLATPHFKHLLLNWLCFLHHRLDASLYPPGKYLVVTSDPDLASWLANHGVITLLLGQNDTSTEFRNLKQLDLLLGSNRTVQIDDDDDGKFIPWGTLHYQALMLERTLTISSLVSRLVERNLKQPGKEVGGVLVVDNDAAWLSSPSAEIHHHYRPDGPNPSFVYATDIEPQSTTSWGQPELPCACFLYARTGRIAHADPYRAAKGAALGWRHTLLCHVASTLNTLEEAIDNFSFWQDETTLAAMSKARAPSFQVTSLGPALYLGQKDQLIDIDHESFDRAVHSGNLTDLRSLLAKARLTGDDAISCEDRAIEVSAKASPVSTDNSMRSAALPYANFPPGRSFFDVHERETGVQPCVVHANYAVKHYKEQILREHGLWALVQEEGREPQCDMDVLRRLHTSWNGDAP